MAIGIGNGADDNELRSIAMNNTDNIRKLASFDEMAHNVKNLTKDLCQGITKNTCLYAYYSIDIRTCTDRFPIGSHKAECNDALS